jgi:hypothetical protein
VRLSSVLSDTALGCKAYKTRPLYETQNIFRNMSISSELNREEIYVQLHSFNSRHPAVGFIAALTGYFGAPSQEPGPEPLAASHASFTLAVSGSGKDALG